MAEPHKEIITIARRWFSSLPPLQIEIECAAELAPGVKLGLAVKAAFARGAVLSCADLSGADLSGAVLPKAVHAMRPADEAEQRARISAVAALALADDDALNMGRLAHLRDDPLHRGLGGPSSRACWIPAGGNDGASSGGSDPAGR